MLSKRPKFCPFKECVCLGAISTEKFKAGQGVFCVGRYQTIALIYGEVHVNTHHLCIWASGWTKCQITAEDAQMLINLLTLIPNQTETK